MKEDARIEVEWPQWWGLAWLLGAVGVLAWRAWHFGRTWRLSARCPAITDGPWQTLLEEERLRMAYGKGGRFARGGRVVESGGMGLFQAGDSDSGIDGDWTQHGNDADDPGP